MAQPSENGQQMKRDFLTKEELILMEMVISQSEKKTLNTHMSTNTRLSTPLVLSTKNLF